jgi:hypothetical protein
MSQKAPQLQATKDYAKFELCQFNRSVEKTKHLRESMLKHGYIPAYPIHCVRSSSGKLQIKAGHHRFEVAQELGIAVFYVVSNDAATIHELETATTAWKPKDYLVSFVRCGMEDYAKVADFHERTGISLGICISMLGGESAGSCNKIRVFKSGAFKVTSEGLKHAESVGEVVRFCSDIGIRSHDFIFVQTLSRCLFVPQFSVEVFKRRAEANKSMFKPCRSIAEQTDLFEAIYNRAATAVNRLPLTFLANQAMISRSVALKKSELTQ